MPYPDVANPDLLERMPLDAKVVLDVGCATGALGAEYKRRNPRTRYLGIERDPAAARIAATRLDQVAAADVEDDPLPFPGLEPDSIDCIVYGDVLEHLRDPWRVLRQQASALSETGTVVVCMPNAEHWSFAERLLRGTWDYEEHGLFDETHLRWFTFDSTRRALTAAGLQPHDVIARNFDTGQAEAFVRTIEPGLRALGIDPEAYLQRATPLQHVWRAGRSVSERISVVSTMLAPVGGVSHVRVVEPLRALASDPMVTTHLAQGLDPQALPGGMPKIFIFHRPVLAGSEGLERLRGLMAKGYLVVCEFDDHPDYIPALQRQPDIQNFRAVHAVQTTTEPLADVLRRENPEVAVFPNGISRIPEPRNFADPNRLTLFFGGLNRERDWPPFLPALNAVAAMAGERLHFRIVNDRGLFDALNTRHKSFTPLCDYDTYQDLLAQSEISFMPLQDTAFNRCKSDLKFVEAAAHRVAALASPIVYGNTVQDGQTGLLFRDASELQQRLARLVANPDLARGLGDAARAYVVRHRMLAYQVGRRTTWYRSLWARREELTRALVARVPELAPPRGAGAFVTACPER
jgi:SAM-dependent methyltransferase